jgi:RNA polymerase sigma-70 factor, ECF subfamily
MSRSSSETQPRFGRSEREFVLRIAMQLLKNRDDAEDVAQDAMLRAFRGRHSFRGDAKFLTWLHRVAVTSALMHMRKQRMEGRSRVDRFDDCVTVPAPGPDPEARAISAVQVARAHRHLARIGPKVGNALRMNAEGYTGSEIAAELGIKATTARVRLRRGRAGLRAALDGSVTVPSARARTA